MNITLYMPENGEIVSHITASDPKDIESNIGKFAWYPGHIDADRYLIINGELQELLPPPPDTRDHIRVNGQWVLDVDARSQRLRHQRNQQLAQVDRINPVWYGSLSDQQRTELADYRQALLDVPQQPGFPAQAEWPQPPHWLG